MIQLNQANIFDALLKVLNQYSVYSSTSFNIHMDCRNYRHKQDAEQIQHPPNIPSRWPFVDRCTAPPVIAELGKEFYI